MTDSQDNPVLISSAEYAALQALAKFQLIEFSLKIYLARRHQLTSFDFQQTTLLTPEAWSFVELDELPFGLLIKRFAKYCGDVMLVDCLYALN